MSPKKSEVNPEVNQPSIPFEERGFYREIQILGTRETPGLLNISRSTWDKWEREGLTPKPYPLGPKALGYKKTEVHQLLKDIENGLFVRNPNLGGNRK